MNSNAWTSPDGLITKTIQKTGAYGLKPTENSECSIEITNCNLNVEEYNTNPVVIGETASKFERLLHNCLLFMHKHEIADVVFNLQPNVSFTLELKDFTSNSFIYNWDAKEKFAIAEKHKAAGVKLFSQDVTEAFYRFSKAIKILASIPIDVQEQPTQVQGVSVKDIKELKANLYNNLASCYLKKNTFETVIQLCSKVLEVESDNVKALYKIGVSYYEVGDYENAEEALSKLLKIEPGNKAATAKLKNVQTKLNIERSEFNSIVKKMFR